MIDQSITMRKNIMKSIIFEIIYHAHKLDYDFPNIAYRR